MSDSDDPSLDEVEENLLKFVEENELDDSGNREAMSGILDGEEALFSSRMKTWLLKDGITELLLEYMTRPSEGEADLSKSLRLSSLDYKRSMEFRRESLLEKIPVEEGEEYEEDDEMGLQFTTAAKRADKAAEVFVYHFPSFPQDYIEKNMESLLKELFRIFDIKAAGDFDNFDKVFHCSLGINPAKIVTIMTQNPTYMLHLLNYLEDTAIEDTALVLMKTVLPTPTVIKFYKALISVDFFDYLGEKLYTKKGNVSYAFASDFFIKLIELCCSFNGADVLFETLGEKPDFVNGLVTAIVDKTGAIGADQQKACVFALRALLVKSGEQLFDQSIENLGQVLLRNMLAGIHDRLHDYLKLHVKNIASKMVEDADQSSRRKDNSVDYNTYKISHRMTFADMAMFDIILELAQKNPDEILTEMDVYVWRVVSGWCFDHKFNNIYHNKFYRLFSTAVQANHEVAFRGLLSKYKFVSKFIDHYMTTTTFTSGFRGTIIKIANSLRLKADSLEKASYLRNFLYSHQAWKQFLPILCDETFKQLTTNFPAPPSTGLSSFGYGQQDFSNSKPLKPITADDVSIELGSDYANDLGFAGTVKWTDSGKKKRKRKRKKKRTSDETEERPEGANCNNTDTKADGGKQDTTGDTQTGT